MVESNIVSAVIPNALAIVVWVISNDGYIYTYILITIFSYVTKFHHGKICHSTHV